MYCPETIKVWNSALYICHHGKGDISWEYRPLAERWNLLRYEVGFIRRRNGGYAVRINRGGALWRFVSDAVFRVECLWARAVKRT